MSPTLFPDVIPTVGNTLSDEERGKLVLSCEALCKKLALDVSAECRAFDLEDLVQEATLACVEAARRWSPTAGSKFSTYATACIRRCLANLVTRTRGTGTVHLERWDAVAAGEPEEATPDEAPLTDRQQYLLSRLSETGRTAVALVLHGLSPNQVAVQMGLSTKDVKLVLRNSAMQLVKDAHALDRPALFDPTDGGDPWAAFVKLLGDLRAELAEA